VVGGSNPLTPIFNSRRGGVIILIFPAIIAYLIGIFLIIIGVLYFVKK
jgi:hypothetical protein